MTYSEALATMGLTQTLAESILYLGAISIAVGMVLIMFWQYIAIGLGVFVLYSVLSHHQSIDNSNNLQVTKSTETSQEEEIISEYVKDCMELTENKDQCEEIWGERVADGGAKLIEETFRTQSEFKKSTRVGLIDTNNQEYKIRRSELLRNPNAVLLHETIR